MGKILALLAGMIALFAQAQPTPQTKSQENAAERGKPSAASRPSRGSSTGRRPEQIKVFEDLLKDSERTQAIEPVGASLTPSEALDARDSAGVLPEGTTIAERPGRLVRVGDHFDFEFMPDASANGVRSMEVLKSEFLEEMQKVGDSAGAQFIVSGEVTRYRNQNFLLIRKLRRQMPHGNLTP